MQPTPSLLPTPAPEPECGPGKGRIFGLTLGALGIVYGDIGTSPLYALRECFHLYHGMPVDERSVLGILSLILWSLIVVVTLKYLTFVMRADNRGEGGILALTVLADQGLSKVGAKLGPVIALGLFGSALLYGDAIITPAISVLSAVEGLEVAAPGFAPYVLPAACLIIVCLFLFQAHGSHVIGRFFGPIMICWFCTLAILGVGGILKEPRVFAAINPLHAVEFFRAYRWEGFATLGSVFLVVTGGEALYADMGHFGRKSIQLGWFAVALPALVLHYFGQGALLLAEPDAVEHPFFRLAPQWAQLPLVGLATMATVIASQAMLTGAFSLSHQAIQLGYLPPMKALHTSSEERKQIYLPAVNWLMLIGTLALVIEFRSSSRLAAAYGIAVTGTMVITTVLTYVVARRRWGWSRAVAIPIAGFFLVFDAAFLGANALKIGSGGWLPLVLGAGVYFIMVTWKRGRAILHERKQSEYLPLERFVAEVVPHVPHRIPGTAVFLSENPLITPPALMKNVRHNRVLHEKVVLLTFITENEPYVEARDTVRVRDLAPGILRIVSRHGFMEQPDVPSTLQRCARGVPKKEGGMVSLHIPLHEATFFLSNDSLQASNLPGMAIFRERIFAFLSHNCRKSASFFNIPSRRAFHIGSAVDL